MGKAKGRRDWQGYLLPLLGGLREGIPLGLELRQLRLDRLDKEALKK